MWSVFNRDAMQDMLLIGVPGLPCAASLYCAGVQGQVVVPAPVRSLDLVASVWPSKEEPRPETLLYMLMGEWPWAAPASALGVVRHAGLVVPGSSAGLFGRAGVGVLTPLCSGGHGRWVVASRLLMCLTPGVKWQPWKGRHLERPA